MMIKLQRETFILKMSSTQVLSKAIHRCFDFREMKVLDHFANALSALDVTILERGWASTTSSITKQWKT